MHEEVELLLQRALTERVSDIHLVPRETELEIYFRVGDELQWERSISSEKGERLIAHLKFLSSMDISERRRPQSGTLSFPQLTPPLDVRLSSLPTYPSESLVLRLLPSHRALPLEDLIYDVKQRQLLQALIEHSHGMIIFTGPTGSGKTTTMYALLQEIRERQQRNIITLEDPIERKLPHLLQMQINEKAGVTYATGLRAILRHDPDVIMVGEIRDEETAHVAVRASLTGHLVLTTLHTKNALGALYRLKEFGISFEDMRQTIVGVCAQRLLTDVVAAKRQAVFELLAGQSLAMAFKQVAGEEVVAQYATLKDAIKRGINDGVFAERELQKVISVDD